jgi:hypothetical protein
VTSGSYPAGTSANVGPFQLSVQDQYGNAITNGSGSPVTLLLSSTSGGSTVFTTTSGGSATTAVTIAANASTSSTFYYADTKAGTPTINASVTFNGSNISTSTSGFTINAGTKSKLVVTTQPPSSMTAGGSASFTVQIQDQYGNVVTSASDTIGVTLSSNSFAGGSTTSVSANSGVANFTNLIITKTGSYTITASDTTSPSVTAVTTSPAFSVTVASASQLAFTAQPTSSTGGIAFPNQAGVTVLDQYGNTVTTNASTVTLSIATGTPTSGGPGAISGCSQSETSGVVTFTGCAINTAGTGYKLTAADGTLTSATSSSFNITVGPVAKFGVSAPGSAIAGTPFNVTLTAQDAGGNTVTSYPSGAHTVAFSGPATTSPGAPGTATPPTYPASVTFGTGTGTGTAAVTLTDAQTTQITASSAGISGTSGNITVSATGASKIATVSGSGQTSTIGTAFANPLVAVVTDTYGNPISGASVTFSGPTSGASITFGSTGCTSNPHTYSCVATTVTTGQATSSTLTATGGAGTYNISASATGTGTVNFSETNKVPLTASSVASGTGTTSVTSSTFPQTSGNTYLITAFESANTTPTTPTPTVTGGGTPTAIVTNTFGGTTSPNCNDSNRCYEWAWWYNAATTSASATVALTFNGTPQASVVDVVALSGNSTTTPIVSASTTTASSDSTTAITANTANAPATGDITLQILASDDEIGTAVTWTPTTTNLYFHNATRNGKGASLQVDWASPGQQNESASASGFGGSQDWGTIALEIGHS